MAVLYGRAGRLTALFGGFRPGQNIARVALASLMANNVRVGDGLLMMRDRVAFRKFFIYSIKLGLTSRLMDNVNNLMKDRLARKWRQKLTATLHDGAWSQSYT